MSAFELLAMLLRKLKFENCILENWAPMKNKIGLSLSVNLEFIILILQKVTLLESLKMKVKSWIFSKEDEFIMKVLVFSENKVLK